MSLPLAVRVGFKARLEVRNVIQIPCVIRWQYKLEPGQVFRVWVKVAEAIGGGEGFHGRMRRDGRLAIPRLAIGILCRNYEVKSLVGEVFEVSLEPAEA